ncbi:hypothetical protein DWY80_19675 [Bacteroides ovatus]|nr:hypothetical protein DWY80_19675 [Bacteroides ovatus]
MQIKVSATQYKPCKANSPWVQKFIVYINFPFPGGELSFPALEITISTAGNESFEGGTVQFLRKDTVVSP